MEYEKTRKIIHMFGFVALLYYVLPVGEFYRDLTAILVVGIVMLFEVLRIFLGFDIPLFRNYEKNTLSGFGWCAIGLGVSFFLFPVWVNVPIVFAWAWIDPFMGYYRKKKWMIPSALILYTLIFYITSIVPFGMVSYEQLIIGPIVAGVGIWSEMLGKHEKLRWLNDDFTMVLFPALAYYLLALFAGLI